MALSKDKKKQAICIKCGEAGLYLIPTQHHVYIECRSGHAWQEKYLDQGGTITRPHTAVECIEDLFTPEEKILYERITTELEEHTDYYKNADTLEKVMHLCQKCQASEQEIYTIFKIITLYQRAMETTQN
ncbi:MAG TPA: hypothetical protein VFC74_10850 [Oscillospiraceae bacterium]|nr:hypothetical protein [Oscillospiraceae bacterium]